MVASNLSTKFPQPSVPFLGDDGNISRAWLYFMLSLFTRTGGTPGVSALVLQEQIAALFVEDAMSDVSFPAPPASLSTLMSMAFADDVPPVQAPSVSPLLALAFADDVPRPGVNPFMAAFMISDVD